MTIFMALAKHFIAKYYNFSVKMSLKAMTFYLDY